MQFKVPQYIEVESKLVGAFSFRQLLYIAGGSAISYILFRIFSWLAIPFIIGVIIFTYLLAFYPKEKLGKPFIEIAESAFKYTLKGKLYTWKRTPRKKEAVEETREEDEPETTDTVSIAGLGNKLGDVSMNLTVGHKEDDPQEKTTGRMDNGPLAEKNLVNAPAAGESKK